MTPLVVLMVERPPTRWAEHLAATAVLPVVLAGVYLLLWRGWRRRAARQADLPPLPPVPETDTVADPDAPTTLAGVYLGTTSAGDWLDRVVARGLGPPAAARLELVPAGVAVHRDGREPFLVPFAALRGVRRDRGIANTVVGEDTVVVLTWAHGSRLLDTGVRGPSPTANARWVTAVEDARGHQVPSRERTP